MYVYDNTVFHYVHYKLFLTNTSTNRTSHFEYFYIHIFVFIEHRQCNYTFINYYISMGSTVYLLSFKPTSTFTHKLNYVQ